MDHELLEVWNLNLAPVSRVKVRFLSAGQRSLDHRMRNAQTIGQGPVAPLSVVSEQATEHVDVRFPGHEGNCIKYQYAIQALRASAPADPPSHESPRKLENACCPHPFSGLPPEYVRAALTPTTKEQRWTIRETGR